MVDIAPFKGLLYKLDELAAAGSFLIAPPYDVLSDQQRDEYLNSNPHNILHLDYASPQSGDTDKYQWHKRSADLLSKWISEGVLERLTEPAIFHMETEGINPLNGKNMVRHGFVCIMRLEEFSETSSVRPHEKTFSSHKEERLSLMKNTNANLSQVFGFFPDEDLKALSLMKASVDGKAPQININDKHGFTHRVWVNQDKNTNDQLCACLKERKVYIADGHHRYETALNYRRFIIEKDGDKADPMVNYLMVYLCPMSDPGLVILPTHRVLETTAKQPDDILESLEKYFKISIRLFDGDEPKAREKFLVKLAKQKNSIGLYMAGKDAYYVLKLLDEAKHSPSLVKEEKELVALDTVILSNVIFKDALGLTENDLDNPDIISYVSDLDQALKIIRDKKAAAAFILNPTSVEDILRVTERGLVMPRKSTYFYPKVTTGLVMNLLNS